MESTTSLERMLDRLEASKRLFGDGGATAIRLISGLGRRHFPDPKSLIRFHEALLFFRAYPANAEIVALTDDLLAGFPARIDRLRKAGVDLAPFEEPDVSGISGTSFSAIFTYEIASWLAARHPKSVEIDWNRTDETLLGPLLYRLHPLFAEDGLVEANIPHMDWFRAAKRGRGSDLQWLLSKLHGTPCASELYAAAKLAVGWNLGNGPRTRSTMRLPGSHKLFFHDGPLLRRSEVSLANELASAPLQLQKLSAAQGQRMLDMARETSAMRYRELHGFTVGDPASAIRTELGRGVEVYVFAVPAAHRLPLRTYHAGLIFKNAIPIGYIECLTLKGRMEVGFNLYYTFREGETAWLYTRLLHVFQQLLDVTCFAVDPYQIGRHNEEAIESGAFWFYRKLGYRAADPEVARLLEKEEKKLRANPDYRTPARVLRHLSAGWLTYELPGCTPGKWDNFEVRRMAMQLRKF